MDKAAKRLTKTLAPPSGAPDGAEVGAVEQAEHLESSAHSPVPTDGIESAQISPPAIPNSSPSETDVVTASAELELVKSLVQKQLTAGETVNGLALLKQYPNLQKELKAYLLSLAAKGKQVTFRSPAAFAATCAPLSNEESLLAKSGTVQPPKPTPSFDEDVEGDNRATVELTEKAQDSSNSGDRKVPTYRPSVRPPMAIVEWIYDGSLGSRRIPMLADRFTIGRKEGDIAVFHELWMSGRHAEIQRRKIGDTYRWFLVDLNSTNGTFIKTEAIVLTAGDELFLGRERYRFINQPPEVGLLHVTRGNAEKWLFNKTQEQIGASQTPMQCMVNDPFLSPVHATIFCGANGTWTVRDNNSVNGVWYRIREVELLNQSEFQLGEQRFRFYVNAV